MAQLVQQLRTQLDRLLAKKIQKPKMSLTTEGKELIDAIASIIANEVNYCIDMILLTVTKEYHQLEARLAAGKKIYPRHKSKSRSTESDGGSYHTTADQSWDRRDVSRESTTNNWGDY